MIAERMSRNAAIHKTLRYFLFCLLDVNTCSFTEFGPSIRFLRQHNQRRPQAKAHILCKDATDSKKRPFSQFQQNMAVFWFCFTLLRKKIAIQTAQRVAIKKFSVRVQQFAEFQRLYAAGYDNF